MTAIEIVKICIQVNTERSKILYTSYKNLHFPKYMSCICIMLSWSTWHCFRYSVAKFEKCMISIIHFHLDWYIFCAFIWYCPLFITLQTVWTTIFPPDLLKNLILEKYPQMMKIMKKKTTKNVSIVWYIIDWYYRNEMPYSIAPIYSVSFHSVGLQKSQTCW